MADPNPFDQFDAPAAAALGSANPFDQFDHAGEPIPDWLMQHGERANILKAFGQGAEQGWGSEPLGLDQETEGFLKKAGIFNDYQDGHVSATRTFNEAIIRPAAVGLDAAMRTGTALFRGVQGAVEALGEFAAHPPPGAVPGPLELIPNVAGLARAVAALPEAFPRGIADLGVPHVPEPAPETVAPEITRAVMNALSPTDLAKARSLGVIGEGEAGWKGTAEPTPETDADRAAAVRQAVEEAKEQPAPAAAQPQPTPVPDIHALARQAAPQVFQEYDALALRRDTYRRWIDDLAQTRQQNAGATAPHQAQIADLQQRLQTANPRMTKIYQNRLDPLVAQRDAYVDDQVARDTPDMTRVRTELQQNDYRMRDLAPQVSAAYREAQAQMPPEIAAEPVGAPVAAQAAELVPAETAPQEGAAAAVAPAETPAPAIPRAVPDIASDVAGKLIAAGRPAEEATAAAQLVSAYYDTRAARFDGAKGTGAELYAAEAPEIERAAGPRRAGAAGMTRIGAQGEATISLMGRADASTFIHELGHSWLEEMLRDAGDPQAPADLTADAATVRGWLGAPEDAVVTTRQHEKFARGFERYMMEGRAPSAGLADVFAKFKQWLTGIYQTVARLRAPITDDIRSVFDRMLATPAEGTVIAPEREGATFADEHERLAETTAPEVAGGVAERVRAEADRHALEREPDAYDELTGAGSGTETGGDTAENTGPDRNAALAGAVSRETRPAEPTGALGAGRSEAAPQSAGVATAERPVAAPTEPDTPLGDAANSRFVDRAGNIRLDLLAAPEDVKQAIRDAAAQNDDFLPQRRGVIPDAEVLRLADALGMRPQDLDQRRLGQAFNAEQVIAARKLLVSSAATVRDAMVKAADGTDADVMAYAEAKERHRMIQGQVAGVTAEAGRALRAFGQVIGGMREAAQMDEFLQDATGRTLFQLRREAKAGARLGTPQKVSKFVADSEKTGFFDWLQSYFINALISGPSTHGTYMVGNTLLALYKATAETAASALIGHFRSASEADRVMLGEVPAQLYGMVRGARYGWRSAWDAFKANETLRLPGEVVASGTAFGKGVIPNPEIGGIKVPVGTVLEGPSRIVTGLHTLTRVVGYETSIGGQAYRIAAGEGLAGEPLAARIADLTANPTEAMMKEAVGEATENAMMQRAPYGGITSSIQKITNAGVAFSDIPLPGGRSIPLGILRPLKFVDPFVAISSNIINAAIVRRTPLGILSTQIRDDLSGRNGGVAFDKAAGRMLAGTSFYIMAGGLAAEGLITGSGPSDPKEAAMKRMTGWQPHSLKIGDIYYDVHRLGALGMALGIAADLYDAGHAFATEDASKVSSMAVHAFAQNVLDESFMRGPSELLQALEDQDRYGPQFVRNFISSFVPFSVGEGQIARTIDPFTRQTRTTLDAVMAKIPWASEGLMPRRDIWGEPIPNKESIIPGLTAIYESAVNADPVNQALLRLKVFPSQPERKIRGVELTEQQYDDLSRIAGRLAKGRLNEIVASPGFGAIPDAPAQELVRHTMSVAREAARSLIMMQNPSIMKAAIAAKLAPLGKPQ